MPPAALRADLTDALPPSLLRLAECGTQRHFRTHSLLIQEGDLGDSIYIVLTGRLRAFVSDARGREVTLGVHGPGEYVGEMSLDGGLRSASVQALEPTVCAVVTRASVLGHIAADPEFSLGLITRLIRRARLATESARSMALLDVYSRLKRVLEDRAQPAVDGTRRIAERLTHQALAGEIGSSREMVSRLLKDLEKGGYVAVEQRCIVLLRALPARW
ncbi:Crp/Fnr family transcriptional regulator [Variovorax sp. PAMC 28711]|uniref:Crp/Fnr family transcriptional regulator n=1 Tax=Variovorax sp. PAMC 28711 TaxID=1795631 RepID=UPI00078B3138|nr:Crp/Fnr family transcriptional regulator [Variovorax sp. PAMC 28711]AMM24899.1 Crp/Fnr family transcriptional regulator [Variovorax sp. PAMC 28711]